MDLIRAATPAEVESIKDKADIQPTSFVVALDSPQGTILAVVRRPVEVDPVLFPEGLNDRMKYIFVRDIANGLKWQGETSFYFNTAADGNESWHKVIKSFGAEQVSPGPEIRWKKVL